MTVFRYLNRTEAYQYREHLLRLDADTRQARFSAVTSDNTIRRYYDDIDWRLIKVIGYFRDGILRGAAEIRYEPRLLPGEAELAFSVERPFQSSGVGTNLMARALINLRNRGVARGHIVCLLANRRMQRLAMKYRANVKAYSGDVFMTIDVPRADAGSLLAECADTYLGWMNLGLDMALQFPGPAKLMAAMLPPPASSPGFHKGL